MSLAADIERVIERELAAARERIVNALAERPSSDDGQRWSTETLAKTLDVSPATVRGWVAEGRLVRGIHYDRPAGRLLFRPAAIRAWLADDSITRAARQPPEIRDIRAAGRR